MSPDRFSQDIDSALRAAGWFPGRDVSDRFANWVHNMDKELAQKQVAGSVPQSLKSVLAEFGGIDFNKPESRGHLKGFPFTVGDVDPWIHPGSARDLQDLLGELLLTFGSIPEDDGLILIGASGKIYLNHPVGGYFHLGENFDEALVNLIRWNKFQRVEIPQDDHSPVLPENGSTTEKVPADFLPATAGVMVAGGYVFSHTSIKGDGEPDLHPLLAAFFADLPANQREPGAGRCAEVVLVSDRLWQMQEPWGEEQMNEAWAYDIFVENETAVTATRIREHGDPTHGTYQPPCRSCATMLDHFGIEAQEV